MTNPDDASTTGSNATEERSESRKSRAPRAFSVFRLPMISYLNTIKRYNQVTLMPAATDRQSDGTSKNRACSVIDAIQQIGSEWRLAVLYDLQEESDSTRSNGRPARFTDAVTRSPKTSNKPDSLLVVSRKLPRL